MDGSRSVDTVLWPQSGNRNLFPLEDQAMPPAIFGAAGAVGKALAAEFSTSGVRFRVVGRSEERLRSAFSAYEPLVEYCPADLGDPQGASTAAQNADPVFYTVGVPYTRFDLHPKLTRIALDAAAAAGVRRFLQVGTVYSYGRPLREFVDETHPRNPHTFKGRMRKEQEDMVLAANGRGVLRTAVLRAPDFYGPDAELSYMRSIFAAAVTGSRANVIGPIDTPHEFVFVPDMAKTLIALSQMEEAWGQAWNLAGPALITVRQFAELAFRAAGTQPKLRVAGKTMLRLFGLFNPFMREVAEMHYLWTTPVNMDDRRLRALLPDLRKTPYEEGIRATIAAMQQQRAGGAPPQGKRS
jgi:nucleoside-diphosphate-sugar epimerase